MRWCARHVGTAWKLVLLLAVVGAAVILHGTALRPLAGLLVVDQRPEKVDYCWVRSGDGCCEEAARLYYQGAAPRILLIEECPNRAEQIGAMPSSATVHRQELGAAGVPPEAIVALEGCARDAWDDAQLLARWQQQHPAAEVLLLCGRYRSGHYRRVLDRVLGREASDRVHVCGLPSQHFDENHWWRSRKGTRELMFGFLTRAYAWYWGEERIVPPRWTIEEYEQVFLQCLRERGP